MTNWAFIVFLLGVLALTFNLFNIFVWLTPWWGLILMIVSLGMLNRVWQMEREGEKEKLTERVEELEAQLSIETY